MKKITQNEESQSTAAAVQTITMPVQINGLNSATGNESRDLVASASHVSEDSGSSGTDLPPIVMGSTDSGGNATSGQSCGLVSSLFPSSCRGRAEAFARRLHHRLTTLGGDDDERKINAVSTPSETSWLHSGGPPVSHSQVLERQPRHSSDSDLYFDFDIDDEDAPGSPAEEVTVAELAGLLLNPETLASHHLEPCHCPLTAKPMAHHQGPESGCVFSSPVTGTSPESDSSDIYYDPESSEGEKITESFYDLDNSESDVSSLSNGLMAKVLAHRHGSPRPEKSPKSGRKTLLYDGETSESCSESNGTKTCDSPLSNHVTSRVDHSPVGMEIPVKENCVRPATSSEDSLNGRSSLDTTSPSHESLWSTFDDSTVSLQDESPARPLNSLTVAHGHVHKSHSDSEIPANRTQPVNLEQHSVQEVDEVDSVGLMKWTLMSGEENGAELSEDLRNESKKSSVSADCGERTRETVKKTGLDISSRENRSTKGSDHFKGLNVSLNDDMQSDTDTDHSTYSSSINIPGALTLECPSGARISLVDDHLVKNEVQLEIKDGAVLNGDVDKMAELLKRLGGSDMMDNDEDDDAIEEEEQRPQRVRRCSSLKTGKTPPGTPGRKKIVRFADVLGLDLADVRTFLDEIPKVPNSAYSDLIYDDTLLKDSPNQQNWHTKYLESQLSGASSVRQKPDKLLVALFQQPGGLPDFLDKVRERQVCLENVLVQDPINLSLSGTVRVRNLDFHKSVHIRYSLNGWRSFSDLQATYVTNSCDGFSDKFIFTLYCHTLNVGQRIEFAVRYQCKGSQYWDNNGGANYCFQCLPAVPSVSYIPITSTDNGTRDWGESAFY